MKNLSQAFRWPAAILLFSLYALWISPAHADAPVDLSDTISWYDTLGFPSVKSLPYVRVATGAYQIINGGPPENRYADGFLVSEDAKTFTVFVCSVSDFKDRSGSSEAYPPLQIAHFTRVSTGPEYKRVGYETLDFAKAASEALERATDQSKTEEGLRWGRPVSHRARIIAFGRACEEEGLEEAGAALMNLAAKIPDEQSGKSDPARLKWGLQQDLANWAIEQAEAAGSRPETTWADLAETYEAIMMNYPESQKFTYAQDAAKVLRKMIADDAVHQSKLRTQMTISEQIAEDIYQLQNSKTDFWTTGRYPDASFGPVGKNVVTPIHRLSDFGDQAVPQLIRALDDQRFSRTLDNRSIHMTPPRIMRVSEIAQIILEHLSGRNFFARKTPDGHADGPTTRQQAEAWWAEVQSSGDKEVLIRAAAAGEEEGLAAANKLVERYPDAALAPIQAGYKSTKDPGLRGEYVEAAGKLPGNLPVEFLRGRLAPANDLYSQVYAAKALSSRGVTTALPAMIDAWHAVQPRLKTNKSDAYGQVGGLITFLARSGKPEAIDALRTGMKGAPIDVRLAVVRVFLPHLNNSGLSSIGPSIDVSRDLEGAIPEVNGAIEKLLVAALSDEERRTKMSGNFENVSIEDPRVCDLAAFILSKRWPEKYQFDWSKDAKQCDAQIAKFDK
jgi:hypothetical protein